MSKGQQAMIGALRRWLNDRWRLAHGWVIRAGQWVRR